MTRLLQRTDNSGNWVGKGEDRVPANYYNDGDPPPLEPAIITVAL